MASTLNADNGVISGSAGLKSTADSSGVLTLQTNGTNALSIDTAQAATFSGAVSVSGNLTAPTIAGATTFSGAATFNGNVTANGSLTAPTIASSVSVTGNVTANKQIFNSAALGTASAGTAEYNGTALFFTPAGTQRGVIPGLQYYELNSTLAMASSTSPQSILGVGVTLAGSTIYAFNGLFAWIKTTTTTAHIWSLGFGGTATVNNCNYMFNRYFNTAGFGDLVTNGCIGIITTASSTALITSSTSATNYQFIQISGHVSINAGGTFIPQITISATGPIYTAQVGSYFSIYPIGAAGANVNVGTWA